MGRPPWYNGTGALAAPAGRAEQSANSFVRSRNKMEKKTFELVEAGLSEETRVLVEIEELEAGEFFDKELYLVNPERDNKLSVALYMAKNRTTGYENWYKGSSKDATYYFTTACFSYGPGWLPSNIIVIEKDVYGGVSVCITNFADIREPEKVLREYYSERYCSTVDYPSPDEFWQTCEWRDACLEWWDILEVEVLLTGVDKVVRKIITPVLNPIFTPLYPAI